MYLTFVNKIGNWKAKNFDFNLLEKKLLNQMPFAED